MEHRVLPRCASCSTFTTNESLQAWIDGKDTDSKSNQKLIKKKIRSTLKPSASFRTYPKLDSQSHFSRKYVSYDDHPHVSRGNKNRTLNRSYTLSTLTTSDRPTDGKATYSSNISNITTTHDTYHGLHSRTMTHSGSTSTFNNNKYRQKRTMPRLNANAGGSKSTTHLLHQKSNVHNIKRRKFTDLHVESIKNMQRSGIGLLSQSQSTKKTNFISRSETITNDITFRTVNLAQQHHKRSEKEERRKREVTKHETAKYVAQLYQPLPQWLQSRLGTKPKKDSHWKLLRESLRANLLTFANKPSLEMNTVRFKIKFILHQLPDFSQFRGDNLNIFLDHCELKCIPANTILYMSGSMGKNCYLILDGSFVLRKRSMNRMQALNNLIGPGKSTSVRRPSKRKQRRKWSKLRSEKVSNRIAYDVLGMQTKKEHRMRFEHNFRMNDCICTENSVLLSIPFQNWWFVNRLLDQEKKRNAQFLLQHREYFRSLSATAQQQITRILKYHKITNGESLYYQDTAANHIYLVVDGEVILNHEIVLQLSNEYPIDHGTTWECKEITRSFHLLVSTLQKGDWFAVESIDENAMNLCTASCVSVHGATILSIPKRDLYLFPAAFEQEIRREFVDFFTKIKDAKDAFKVQYLERITTINDKMGRNENDNLHSKRAQSTLKRSLSMQQILECNQRGNDKLMVERKDPMFQSKMRHIETLRAEMFGPLHLQAVELMKHNADRKALEAKQDEKRNSWRKKKGRSKKGSKTAMADSMLDVVMKMTKYEHGTKHEMRKDSRFKSNKCLRMMAEKRAKQTFVAKKMYRIHREAVDISAMCYRKQRRGVFSSSVHAIDTGIARSSYMDPTLAKDHISHVIKK